MSWFLPVWLVLVWLAAWNGRSDARRMIPDQNDARPPAYLNYLRRWGEKRGQRLAVSWKRLDLRLNAAYQHSAVIYAQESLALERAVTLEADLLAQWEARKTQANRAACQRTHTMTEAARQRRNRAERADRSAISRRQTAYDRHRALWHSINQDVGKLMAVYVTANVRAREGNAPPPALHEDAWPQLRCPEQLAELQWDPPLRKEER